MFEMHEIGIKMSEIIINYDNFPQIVHILIALLPLQLPYSCLLVSEC